MGETRHTDAIGFATVDAGSEPARRAMGAYFAELDSRFAGGFDAAGELDAAPLEFNPPNGLFVVVTTGVPVAGDEPGSPVGCGAVRFLDAETGEIKRMWVSETCRGAGVGGRLLAHLEQAVRGSGRTRVVLDTNASLAEAIALYRRRGYAPIPRYNANPYAHHWFEKRFP